jgi:hypothetical protein
LSYALSLWLALMSVDVKMELSCPTLLLSRMPQRYRGPWERMFWNTRHMLRCLRYAGTYSVHMTECVGGVQQRRVRLPSALAVSWRLTSCSRPCACGSVISTSFRWTNAGRPECPACRWA